MIVTELKVPDLDFLRDFSSLLEDSLVLSFFFIQEVGEITHEYLCY